MVVCFASKKCLVLQQKVLNVTAGLQLTHQRQNENDPPL
jgi:hypothetical protein